MNINMLADGSQRRSQRQHCKRCGARGFNFHVSDETWEKVAPPEYRGLVLCLTCFDELASERGVSYANEITTLYFAGEKATFFFEPVKVIEP